MKKKFLLIDGNAFCYRAFYAIKGLSNSSGMPTNAVFGFVTMLNKLVSEHKPDYLGVAFDLKGPTFRHQRFADYKVQRKPMADELSVQIPIIKKVLGAYHIPVFEKKGYEADDIIATLVRKLTNCDLEILIITGDKDILQIVSKSTKVINPQKDNMVLDEQWVRRRYGVSPEQIREIIALAGDPSDNIPGVPGIGEASAIELIKQYHNLETVLAQAQNIANKARSQSLQKFSQQARMSRALAQLDSNVGQLAQGKPSDLLEQLKIRQANKEKLYTIFKELEFKSLMSEVAPETKTDLECRVVTKDAQAKELLSKVADQKKVALYFWASDPEPMRAKILGASLAIEQGAAFFFSAADIGQGPVKSILENERIQKIGHNLKYLKVLLASYGINMRAIGFDTMIAAYLLDPAKPRYSLWDLCLEQLNSKLQAAPELETSEQTAKFCGQNVNVVLRLNEILQQQLRQKNLWDLFQNIEMPLIEVLADMERQGVALDKDLLLRLSCEFERKLKSLTKDIYEMAGEEFNINSPKQLSRILFERLKLPRIKRTKTGSSTNTAVLQKLQQLHPIALSLLEFRELSKLKSTYTEGLIKLIHPKTGRIHTSFNQAGTATGRLSSSRPNLQNIPIRTEMGRKIRQAFIAEKKQTLLLSADYSQIELRILAHLCEDKKLIAAFHDDLDIHAYTASLIFGRPLDQVTTEMRSTAKTVNFGINYGMTPFGLSKDLGIEQRRAEEFITAYFQRYPKVKSFIDQQIKKAKKYGFVTTLLNRRRYTPQINSREENVRQFGERIAINTPVQGSASDLIKAAMIATYRTIQAGKLATKMLLQVHDELLFVVPEKELEPAKALIKDKMENVIKLKVPVKVSIKVGRNWLDMN